MIHHLLHQVEYAARQNQQNILELLEQNPTARLLDIGCDDGEWTTRLANAVGTPYVFGIDITSTAVDKARKKNIQALIHDANVPLPFPDQYFDVIHANQVIEHIHNVDLFIREIYRILTPSGFAIISTENLASWHNVFALILGFQPFSATNFIYGKNIGNPLSLHRKSTQPETNAHWCHDKLWAYTGLKELFASYDFSIDAIRGAGYYPLPSWVGNYDVRHCHWITFKLRRAK